MSGSFAIGIGSSACRGSSFFGGVVWSSVSYNNGASVCGGFNTTNSGCVGSIIKGSAGGSGG